MLPRHVRSWGQRGSTLPTNNFLAWHQGDGLVNQNPSDGQHPALGAEFVHVREVGRPGESRVRNIRVAVF